MKKSFFTLLFFLLFSCLCLAQSTTVVANGISFTPKNLTINAGQTVQWNNTNGVHNVNGSLAKYPGNPAGFFSGNPVNAPWSFSHTFTTPGFYNYSCDPHETAGMTGTITVLGGTDDVIITEIMYNNPGADDYEFIEFYNKGATAVQMENWTISNAINFTFPAYTLDPGAYVVVALNKTLFEAAFGGTVLDWNEASNNVLNNTGEPIVLKNAAGAVIDSVFYSDSAPWPTAADGLGPSLVLCDFDSDNNNGANWAAAITPTGFSVSGMEILANPGAASGCPAGAVVQFVNTGFTLLESAGNIFVRVAISGGGANPTQVTLNLDASSTATPGADFTPVPPITVTFPAGVAIDTQTVTIQLVDDQLIEDNETIVLHLTNPTNGAIIAPNGGQFTLTILDNDALLTQAMVITGIFDTQVEAAGTWAKGVELQAIQDIPDASIFAVGFANNGGGTDGIEATLPPISLTAGECVWVANDSTLFFNFFGFYPTLTDSDAGINGDDAIELFENNIVIDVFGEISYPPGSTLPWNYMDGWAYRQSGTGPDGVIFNIDNWKFSGINALDLVPNNASAPNPVPICTYSSTAPNTAIALSDNATTPFNTAININILGNDVLPNPLTSMSVTVAPANGTAVVNGLTNITYTPNQGFCGADAFTYEICDLEGCDEAVVNVTVQCPSSYPPYNIALVTTVNANGQPDSLGRTCQLQGIVHGIDFQGGASIQFALIDATGGISVFSNNAFGYTVKEGDELIVRGTISQFSCLTQITPDTLWLVSAGNPLVQPTVVTVLNENVESSLVELQNLTLVNPGQWTGTGPGFNVQVTNGTVTNTMRIDNDCELYSMPAPTGTFHARGIGGQFDTAPCDDGYQFFPRYAADIIPVNSTDEELLSNKVKFFPNPVGNKLFIQSEIVIDDIIISNTLGQQLMRVNSPGNSVETAGLISGVYTITFRSGEAVWSERFVKQ